MSRERFLADRRFLLKSLGVSLVAAPMGLGSTGLIMEAVKNELSPDVDESVNAFRESGITFTDKVVEAVKLQNSPSNNLVDELAYKRLNEEVVKRRRVLKTLKVGLMEMPAFFTIIVGLGGVSGILYSGWELVNNELDFRHAKKQGWV